SPSSNGRNGASGDSAPPPCLRSRSISASASGLGRQSLASSASPSCTARCNSVRTTKAGPSWSRIERRSMNRLDGKIAFLSGAARGIGAEAARLMVEAGARVVIADILDERGRETARALEVAGGDALYVHLDVTRAAEWTAAVAAAVARFGGIDILVNNA